MDETQGKLFAGARLRRLRRELGQSQGEFAASLGISASYLTLLERNQRPLTARVLLALAESYDIDVRAFASEADRQLVTDLTEALSDPVLKGAELDARDIRELADAHPRAAEGFARLYLAYRETQAATADLAARLGDGAGGQVYSALEAVRDALDTAQNHFPALETAADRLRSEAKLDELGVEAGLTGWLRAQHGAAVRTYDDAVMGGALRRFDFHARKLLLAERLSAPARLFHMATTIVLLDCAEALDAHVTRAAFPDPAAAKLYRASLASYTAAALLMPYDRIFEAAEASRYDIDLLARRFAASVEQVCHRLTTLSRPSRRGVPFFLVKLDQAGNVTKRFGGGVIPFARSGGGCARWRLHDAFRMPERVHVQAVELTDGSQYLSIARAVERTLPGGGTSLMVVALGCEMKEAPRLGYMAADQSPTGIGLSCRLCERNACAERAFPPLQRSLRFEPHVRGASPFSFG